MHLYIYTLYVYKYIFIAVDTKHVKTYILLSIYIQKLHIILISVYFDHGKCEQKDVVTNLEFLTAVSQQNLMGKSRGLKHHSNAALRTQLQLAGIECSDSVLKKAVSEVAGWQRDEVLNSFRKIDPFLSVYRDLNPGFAYKIHLDKQLQLENLCVIFPYAKHALQHSYEVLGIDGAHQKDIVVSVSDDGRVLLGKMQVIMITGRGPNNAMLIYGFVMALTENSHAIGLLIELGAENGVNFNDPKFVTITDQGSSLLKAHRDFLGKTLHMLCGRHLNQRMEKVTNQKGASQLFWKARNAKTLVKHNEVMTKLNNDWPKAYAYLETIEDNWQLFKVVESGRRLYDIQTQNMVEQVFAWTLDQRHYPAFYYIRGNLIHIIKYLYT